MAFLRRLPRTAPGGDMGTGLMGASANPAPERAKCGGGYLAAYWSSERAREPSLSVLHDVPRALLWTAFVVV